MGWSGDMKKPEDSAENFRQVTSKKQIVLHKPV